MNTERFTQIFAGKLDWLDMGTKVIQQPDRLCDRGSHFRMDYSSVLECGLSVLGVSAGVRKRHGAWQKAEVLCLGPGEHKAHARHRSCFGSVDMKTRMRVG
jgi:hypothetical protein